MCMFSHLSHQYGVTVLANHDTIIQDQKCKSMLSSLIQRAVSQHEVFYLKMLLNIFVLLT